MYKCEWLLQDPEVYVNHLVHNYFSGRLPVLSILHQKNEMNFFMYTFSLSSVAIFSVSDRNIPSYLLCRENSNELHAAMCRKGKKL